MLRNGFRLSCLWLLLATPIAFGSPPRLEVYGDSLSAGLLAKENLVQPPELKSVSRIFTDFARYLITSRWEFIEAHQYPNNAWPARLAHRLREAGAEISLFNKAVAGDGVEHLMAQVKGMKTDDSTTAIFFIGANNLCENFDEPARIAERYVAEYEKVVKAWSQDHHHSRAVFIPVPRIDRIYTMLRGYTWYQGDKGRYRCDDSWRIFRYCPSFYGMALNGSLEAFMTSRVGAMNEALERMAKRFDEEKGTNRFDYLPNVHAPEWKPEYFSVDCYHPSAYGQDQLAESMYREGNF